MATEKPAADGFLAVIEKKIAALQALADSYRAAVSIGALGHLGEIDLSGTSGVVAPKKEGPIELPQGALLGKSLPAAVRLWLESVRRKQTVREIANGLREGGVESTSTNFDNVVNGALHRLKASGEVLRFKDGWALAELYPAFRASQPKDAPAPKKAKGEQPAKVQAVKPQPKAARAASETNKSDALLAVIPSDPNKAKTINELIAELREAGIDVSRDYARVAMKRFRKRGKVESREGRHFRVSPRAGSNAA